MTNRRIYVACLAAYNSGILHGVWIDTEGMDKDDLSKEVREKVLLTSPCPNVEVECPKCEGDGCDHCKGSGKVPSSEEYAIHDHEGYPSGVVGEYTPFSEIAKIEEILEDVGDDNVEAFMIWINECQSGDLKDADADKFRDAYRGQYDSPKAFAEEFAVETEAIKEDHPMFAYIDWEYYWTGNLQHSFTYSAGYVFCDE